MSANASPVDGLKLRVEKTVEIDAGVDATWQSILDEFVSMTGEKGEDLKFKFEAWPGGRWFRDLGDGAGHLWGHVQVIKPPKLLEISGPLMIPSASVNHISYRVTPSGAGGSTLKMVHTGVGLFDAQMAAGMEEGWGMWADSIKKRAEKGKR